MTAQKAQIELLIQEIDDILVKTAPRLPWLMPSDAVKQRQVLEQTRRYLVSLQEDASQSIASQFPEGGIASQPAEGQTEFPVLSESSSAVSPAVSEISSGTTSSGTTAENVARSAEVAPAELPQTTAAPASDSGGGTATDSPAFPQSAPAPAQAPAQTEVVESAQQALQAVVQEMNYLRSNLLQPMRSDLEVLRQQRETLVQEIRQLEAHRQQYALPQQNQLLMEFLQAAFRQMQENLTAQVSQMMATLPAQNSTAALPEGSPNPSYNSEMMALSPAQRLEQIQRVQTQSDQLLLKLDSSLRVIFSSLQQNVESYQDSLEQGLSRMHNLGQQGEAMFSALVTRLAEQLGREASTFLQSSIAPGGWEPVPTAAPDEEPGAQPNSVPETEEDIARLLDELTELDAAQPGQVISPFARDARIDPMQNLDEDQLNSLDLLDLELQNLDLDALSPEPFAILDEDITLFQEEPLDAFLSTDLTVLQDDWEPEVIQPSDLQSPDREFDAAPRESDRTETADSATDVLDLLNQLGVVPQETEQAEPHSDQVMPGSDPEAAQSSIGEPPLIVSPDSLYEDEFYQSLFGDVAPQSLAAEELLAEAPAEPEAAAPADASADEPSIALSSTVQEDLFGNFAEPEAMSRSEELTLVEAPDLPQTVENILLPPTDLQPSLPSSPPMIPQEELRPVAETTPQTDPTPIEFREEPATEQLPAAIETVGSLLELIPFESSYAVENLESSENSIDRAAGPAEVEFELAQPGEDLLADEPSHPAVLLNVQLPADTLEQLEQDLSSLEGEEGGFAVPETDWMLPDAEGTVSADSFAEELFSGNPDAAPPEAQPSEWDLRNDLVAQPPSRAADAAEDPSTQSLEHSSDDRFGLDGLETLFGSLSSIASDPSPPATDQTSDRSAPTEPPFSDPALHPSIASEDDVKKKS